MYINIKYRTLENRVINEIVYIIYCVYQYKVRALDTLRFLDTFVIVKFLTHSVKRPSFHYTEISKRISDIVSNLECSRQVDTIKH